MEGFRRDARGGGDARLEYSAGFGDSEQLLQQHHHTLQRGRSTPAGNAASAAARSLPGFATFLREPDPRHERNSFLTEYLALSSVPSHREPQDHRERMQHRQRELHCHNGRSQHCRSTAAFSPHSKQIISRTQSQRSPMSDASSGSPHIYDFKNIAIIRTASSGTVPTSYQKSVCSPTTGVARTRTNYTPQVCQSSVSIRLPLPQQQQLPPVRTSRYLREIDRRNILRRIEQGEKQATLAKEYQVSRAAISNLKQRRSKRNHKDQRLVGSAQATKEKLEYERNTDAGSSHQQQLQFVFSGNSNQAAHQPHHGGLVNIVYSDGRYDSAEEQARSPSPVSSSPSGVSPYAEIEFTLPTGDALDQVIEVKTATTDILLIRLTDPSVDAQTSRIAKSRIARLLLETAMGEFPTQDVKIPMASCSASLSGTRAYYMGVEHTKPTCVVKIVSDRDNDNEAAAATSVLLREFQKIEPFCEVGSSAFTFDSSLAVSQQGAVDDECTVHLPQNIHESNVLLAVDFLDAHSSEEAAKTLQAILRAGVQQRDLYLVSICSHESALRYLLELFPQLRIFTAKLLAHGGQSSSGVAESIHARFPSTENRLG